MSRLSWDGGGDEDAGASDVPSESEYRNDSPDMSTSEEQGNTGSDSADTGNQ